jgi:hypothetical protein
MPEKNKEIWGPPIFASQKFCCGSDAERDVLVSLKGSLEELIPPDFGGVIQLLGGLTWIELGKMNM